MSGDDAVAVVLDDELSSSSSSSSSTSSSSSSTSTSNRMPVSSSSLLPTPWPVVDVTALPVVSYRIKDIDNADDDDEDDISDDDNKALLRRWRAQTLFRRPSHFLYSATLMPPTASSSSSNTTSSTAAFLSGGSGGSAVSAATHNHYELDDSDDALVRELRCDARVVESALDALEAAWFKRYVASNRATDRDVGLDFAAADDDLCAACDNGDTSDDNQIVYCDACNVPLHQRCYGLDTLPAGRWECDPCRLLTDLDARLALVCALCKRRRAKDYFLDAWRRIRRRAPADAAGGWVHVACVLWIPESFFEDTPDHAVNIDNVLKDRFSLKCVVCQKYGGACIQCTFSEHCSTSFHVPCARARFYELDIADAVANCERHRQRAVAPIARYPPAGAAASRRAAAKLPTLKQSLSAAANEPPLLSRTAALEALADALGGAHAPAMQHAARLIEHWRRQRIARGGLPLRANDNDDDLLNQSHKAAFLELCKAGPDALADVYDGLRRLRRDLGRAEQLLALVREREALKAKRVDARAREIAYCISPLAAAHAFFVERLRRDDDVIVAEPGFPHDCALADVRTFDVQPLGGAADAAATTGDALVRAVLDQLDGVRCRPEDPFRYNRANVEAARKTALALALDDACAPELRRYLSAEFIASAEAHLAPPTTIAEPQEMPVDDGVVVVDPNN